MTQAQPILVFDSGIGGLSILTEIRKKLPTHDYVYLFDNARLPYGEQDEQVLIQDAVGLIEAAVKDVNAIMVVVACNTASTIILPALRSTITVPVVGVVPAIKPASQYSKEKKIGLLATPATIQRSYTHELIELHAYDCEVELLASSRLVQLAEDKFAGKAINQSEIKAIIQPFINKGVDTIVLGCTHFPLLRAELNDATQGKMLLMDSGTAIAKRVEELLIAHANHQSSVKRSITAMHTTNRLNDALTIKLYEYGFLQLTPYKKAQR